jgi:predicted amidohydrolase YtcJ
MSQLLVEGGTILTQDQGAPEVRALLVEDGAVLATGEDAQAASAGAERLDLEGGFACPAFIDAHNHFMFSVLAELGVDCRTPPMTSVAQIVAAMRRAVVRTPPGEWVRGWGYLEIRLAEGRHPSLAELDRIAPEHPLVIGHGSGHMCVANTPALRAAGITESSPDPPNGLIERRRGRLTGVLHEQAAEMVDVLARNALIAGDPASCLRAARTVAQRYAALGLTTICDPCVPATVEPLYAQLRAEPDFPLELVGLGMGAQGMFLPPADRMEDPGGDGFSIRGVKFFADGGEQCAVCMSKRTVLVNALRTVRNSLRHRTLLAKRVAAGPSTTLGRDGKVHVGIKFYDDGDLAQLLGRTVGHGLTAAVHAMGNEAIDQVLGAVEQARRRAPDDAVFRMEHAMLAAEPSLPRIADLGIAAVVQPTFVRDFGFPLLLTGMNRSFRVLAFRDLIDSGVLLAGSSDAPVSDPAVLAAIEAAVTRRTQEGEALDRDQAISVDEALAMYTVNAARVLGLGPAHGTLAAGAPADFVVLSGDPRAVEPERISSLRVERTYRAGRRVH